MSAGDLDVSENSVRQEGPVYLSFQTSALVRPKYSLSHRIALIWFITEKDNNNNNSKCS